MHQLVYKYNFDNIKTLHGTDVNITVGYIVFKTTHRCISWWINKTLIISRRCTVRMWTLQLVILFFKTTHRCISWWINTTLIISRCCTVRMCDKKSLDLRFPSVATDKKCIYSNLNTCAWKWRRIQTWESKHNSIYNQRSAACFGCT